MRDDIANHSSSGLCARRISSLTARLRQSGFARAAGILVGGNAAAHLITAISLPIVTRLYLPADMSILAVFSSLLNIFAAAACLRFDIAVSVPEDDGEAINLFALGLVSAIIFSAVLELCLMIVPIRVYQQFNRPELAHYLLLLPLAVLFTGLYSLSQFWFVRRRAFFLIAKSRILQSASSAAAQIGLGVSGIGPVGLIVGAMLNGGAGFIVLFGAIWRRETSLSSHISLRRMVELLRRYYRFPVYSMPEAVTNAAAIQLPVVLIAAWASKSEAGYLMLAAFVIQAPMSLIGTALGQVFLSEAPARYRDDQLGSFTISIIGGLARVGVGPLLAMGIASPTAFGVVFGPGWERAGELLSWMTPWFALQLMVSPVSLSMNVTNYQRAALIFQSSGMMFRVGAVVLAGYFAPKFISESYAVSGAVFYFTYLLLVLYVVRGSVANLGRQLRRAAFPLLMWCGVGGVGAAGFAAIGRLI